MHECALTCLAFPPSLLPSFCDETVCMHQPDCCLPALAGTSALLPHAQPEKACLTECIRRLGPLERPNRIYIDGGDEFGIFGSLVAVKCAAITDATVDRLLHHIRLLEGVQSCACGRAFVYAGPPEACDACLMCASAEVLSEVEVCAICRDDAHTSFAHKCPDCSCLLHQSCLYKLCYSDTFGFAKCPQCRRTLKRPAEVELTVL